MGGAFSTTRTFASCQIWESGYHEISVNAMGAYFERRSKRPRPRSFVKVEARCDVAKGLKLREAMHRGECSQADFAAWSGVSNPAL